MNCRFMGVFFFLICGFTVSGYVCIVNSHFFLLMYPIDYFSGVSFRDSRALFSYAPFSWCQDISFSSVVFLTFLYNGRMISACIIS